MRGGRERNVLLTSVLEAWLKEHNRFPYQNTTHPFSESAIAEAIRRISDVPLNDGLVRANEQLYDLLSLGISLPQTIVGDTRHYSLQYVDWKIPRTTFITSPKNSPLNAKSRIKPADPISSASSTAFPSL